MGLRFCSIPILASLYCDPSGANCVGIKELQFMGGRVPIIKTKGEHEEQFLPPSLEASFCPDLVMIV